MTCTSHGLNDETLWPGHLSPGRRGQEALFGRSVP